jgi:hypothetical protein
VAGGLGPAGASPAGSQLPAAIGLAADGREPPLPDVKPNPHTSQNLPDRAVPHTGQGSPGGAPVPGGSPMRTPHTSQKSSLAEA